MTTRARRQTRARSFGGWDPVEHNAVVARRLRIRRFVHQVTAGRGRVRGHTQAVVERALIRAEARHRL